MRKLRQIVLVIVFLCLLFTLVPAQPPTSSESTSLAIRGVTVIDATGVAPKPNMTVLITNGRISKIGNAAKLKIPASARVIDGRGRFLIPGLWDMHTHIWDKDMLFPVYLANGITGVRDMGGVLEPWTKWRSQIGAGEILGPRSVISGKIVDGFKPFFYFFVQASLPEQGRDTVKALTEKGADFIKVYDRLPRDTYFAIAAEAGSRKISFAGHVPTEVKASEASIAGQRSIEHLTGIALECATNEAELRTKALTALNDARKEGLKPAEMSTAFRRYYELSRYAPLETYSDERAKRLFQLFHRNHTWQVPTLVVREHFGDETIISSVVPHLKYFPQFVGSMILPESKATAEERQKNKQHFRKEIEIVKAMRKAGVRFLAGSDAPNPFSVPGFGLHEELALLVEAGFTPMEALQTATRNAAEFLGQLDSLGTVEPGKVADLVLLDANPLADIKNTRQIAAVILNGQPLLKKQLKKMLEDLEAQAKKK